MSSDSPAPKSPQELIAFLDDKGIEHQTREHDPVFTVEESQQLKQTLEAGTPGGPGGGHVKNLYLKNKKSGMWLLTLHEDTRLDIKAFAASVESPRLSFGSPDRLMENLGVLPGSVTPFSVINDPDHKVSFLLDAKLMEFDQLHFHPLTNSMTTMIKPDGLEKFLVLLGRELKLVNL